MSNFLEQELRKLFADGGMIDDPKFVGRTCLGSLDGNLRVWAEFISMNISSQYNALRLTVLNRKEGVVDKSVLRFEDVLGKKAVPGSPNFRNGVSPHIWDDRGKADWYVYRPTPADFEALRQAADARKLCKPGAPVCMFIDWRQLPAASDALQWAGRIWRGTAVWDKGNSRPQKGRFRHHLLAAVLEGYTATGIEVTEEYARRARERIAAEFGQAA